MSKVHVQYSNKRVRRQPAKILARLIQAMSSDSSSPFIVLIGGPGGSGKSTISEKIRMQLNNAAVLALDDYKTSRALRKAQNIFGPHPRANEMAMIKEHLICLKKGRAFDKPVYNRRLGRISRFEKFSPRPVTLVEGEIATYKPFRPFASLTIFVDAHWKTLLNARLIRDIAQRGYDTDKTIATFLHSNLREFSRYGADSKRHADIHIYCDKDFHFFIESVERSLFETHREVFETGLHPINASSPALDIPLPLTSDLALDLQTYDDYLNALFQQGRHRIIVGHFCGEHITLTQQEHKTLFQSACEFFPGEITAYITAGNLHDTQRLAASAKEYGADTIIIDMASFKSRFPARGIKSYQESLHAANPDIIFGSPADVRLKNNPARAKQSARKTLTTFPATVRPPF